jgi:hypothetical protein
MKCQIPPRFIHCEIPNLNPDKDIQLNNTVIMSWVRTYELFELVFVIAIRSNFD